MFFVLSRRTNHFEIVKYLGHSGSMFIGQKTRHTRRDIALLLENGTYSDSNWAAISSEISKLE